MNAPTAYEFDSAAAIKASGTDDTPAITRAPNRAERRASAPRAARSTTIAERITLRQNNGAAAAARTERARRVRARRQAIRDARRAAR